MKRKFAILLVFCFSVLSILTGCNLFDTNNYAALSSTVATNGDVTITREQLINAYNAGGYYYASIYGLSQEDAFKRIINELVDDAYYTLEVEDAVSTVDNYKLTSQDYSDVVRSVWDYVNQGMSTYLAETKKVFDIEDVTIEGEEEADPEFKPQAQYESKFELLEDGRIAYIEPQDTNEHRLIAEINSDEAALEYAQTRYNYSREIHGGNQDLKNIVWKKYMAALKSGQSNYNYEDMSDTAVFGREVKRLFDAVLKSTKQTKYQNETVLSANFTYDATIGRYILNDTTLGKMVDYYKETYESNYNFHAQAQTQFYKDVTNTSNRGNYVYFGNKSEETLITCSHILIKLSETQTTDMSSIESNKMYQGSAKESAIYNIRKPENTYAQERSLTTGQNIEGSKISVADLYSQVLSAVENQSTIEKKVEAFNSYLYKYNVDPGIINAQFDYVVGTETSAMVESFTDAVRGLYDNGNGEVGSVTMVYEDNSNYKGYHIIIYTGTLDNAYGSLPELNSLTSDNIYDTLSGIKTSLSYGETMFEFVYDKVVKDSFSTYKSNLIKSRINGTETVYVVSNYSDLYSK